ncbi:hypothetical protein FRC02_002648 [Tulasnella sp. 418]|nr:hypothetical protein FRC02_002648 [Tulasnella sp. 418]
MWMNVCNAYSKGYMAAFYVLQALQGYDSSVETIPSRIEAYCALVKVLRVTIELYPTPDNFYLLDAEEQRRAFRGYLDTFGSQILWELERILSEVSDLIISMQTPTPEAAQHMYLDPKGLRVFVEEILLTIKDGLEEFRWVDESRPSGKALWRTAEVVEQNSTSLRILLNLMSKTVEDAAQYSTLFRDHPSVAPVLISALNSSIAQVRKNAFLLICSKARYWFRDSFISQSFIDSQLDEYLVRHLQADDTSHRTVRSLVTELELKPEWRTWLHKVFHGLALSSIATVALLD